MYIHVHYTTFNIQNGNSPLHIAVHSLKNTLKIINTLYENGADIKARNLVLNCFNYN